MRERIERQEELETLQSLLETLLDSERDNRFTEEAIQAQIEVISEKMGLEEIMEEFEEDGEIILNAALDAMRWLREDAEAPSEQWAPPDEVFTIQLG